MGVLARTGRRAVVITAAVLLLAGCSRPAPPPGQGANLVGTPTDSAGSWSASRPDFVEIATLITNDGINEARLRSIGEIDGLRLQRAFIRTETREKVLGSTDPEQTLPVTLSRNDVVTLHVQWTVLDCGRPAVEWGDDGVAVEIEYLTIEVDGVAGIESVTIDSVAPLAIWAEAAEQCS